MNKVANRRRKDFWAGTHWGASRIKRRDRVKWSISPTPVETAIKGNDLRGGTQGAGERFKEMRKKARPFLKNYVLSRAEAEDAHCPREVAQI